MNWIGSLSWLSDWLASSDLAAGILLILVKIAVALPFVPLIYVTAAVLVAVVALPLMLERVAKDVPMEKLGLHFHDTRGQALANLYACLELGARIIDSAVAGLGGCPYANGATGNVATEDVLYMLQGMDIETGIDLESLLEAGRFISAALNRAPASKLGRIGKL